MLFVLIKLGSKYSVFVSTFHCGRDCIPNSKMPSLDGFTESLIQSQDKLVQMGFLQTSKNQALLMSGSTNMQAKGKQKGKEPIASDSKPKESQKSSKVSSSSKKKKFFEKTKCLCCMRRFHLEIQCMKKHINQLSVLENLGYSCH